MKLADLYERYRPKNPEQFLYFASLYVSRLINLRKDPRTLSVDSILVCKYDEIGDVVLSLHTFELLKHSYPQARITVFCKPYARDILLASPHIDTVITNERDFAPRYDIIVELRGTVRSALYALFHPPLYRVDRGAVRLLNRRKGHRHEIDVNYQIIEPLLRNNETMIQPVLLVAEEHRTWAEQYIGQHALGSFAMLHPAARKPLKRWPIEHYTALAERLYREKGWNVVLVGMGEDMDTLSRIATATSVPVHLLVDKPLLHVAALAERAQLFVGNDSGPMHIAAAVGAPAVGLFGPGSPELFAPVGVHATFIHHKLHCNPCDQVHCVYPENPCMKRISVEEVLAVSEQIRSGRHE